jgi:hypothetical protein
MPTKQTTRLREDVHKFIHDDDFELAVSALRDGLKAQQTVRRNREDGQRGVEYEEVPSHTVRITAAKLLLEYGFGKPATRAEITVSKDNSQEISTGDILSRFRNSGMDLNEIVDVYAESVKEEPLTIENES